MTRVEDLMTTKVITVTAETPLAEAVNLLSMHNFNGLPVIDEQGVLQGLLRERDLVSNESYVHLKTLLKLVNEVKFYKHDNSPIREDLKKIMSLTVKDVMTIDPYILHPESSIEETSRLFGDPKINPIPVTDDQHKLVGILSLSDLTKLYGVSPKPAATERELDLSVERFLNDFERKFVVVTKARTETWLFASILFAIVGFVIAFLFILRISV